jgi:Transposase DDE domain
MSIEKQCSTKGEQLSEFFGAVCGRLGHESGLVQRQSRLSASKLAQGLILGSLKTGTARLNQFCQVLADLEVDISESGLHYRLNAKTVRFLERLTAYALEHWHDDQPLAIALLQRFSAVRIVDSSQITLPPMLASHFPGTGRDGQAASMKVSLSYDFLSGRLEALRLEAGKRPDQTNPLATQPQAAGGLTLMDLGFYNQATFASLAQQSTYFLSRLKLQAGVYASPTAAKALVLARHLPTTPAARGECPVYLGSKQRLPVRLLYERLPPAVIQQRRRKAKAAAQKRGTTCSQGYLDLLAWTLYVTNIPVTLARADELRPLYRLRWQIELIFKLWKSYAHVDVVGTWRLERVLCQFYARVLALLLFHWLAMSQRWTCRGELSLPKAFQFLQGKADQLLTAIQAGSGAIDRLCQHIQRGFRRFALKQKRRTSPSTLDLLILVSEP